MADNKVLIGVIVVIAALVLFQGQIAGFLGGSSTPAQVPSGNIVPSSLTPPSQCSSDLKTTITLNTKDSLATVDTNANISYYLFNKKDDSFVKTGTTATGTTSFDVNCLESYKLLAFTDASWYPVETEFSGDNAGVSTKTINIPGIMPVSNATIELKDPLDLNGNISVGLGKQVAFRIDYWATSASSAVYKPVLIVDVNQTAVQDVAITGLSKVTCPQRVSITSARKKYCFQDTTLKSIEGIRSLNGNVLFSTSATSPVTDYLYVDVLDTQGYLNPNYANIGRSAVKEGTENPNDLSNVGAKDSQSGAAADHANSKNYLYFGG